MAFKCKDCVERKVGCHATCLTYLKECSKNEKRRKARQLERALDELSHDLVYHRQKTRRSV